MDIKKFMLTLLRLAFCGAGCVFFYLFIIQVPRKIFNIGTILGAVAGTIFLAVGIFFPQLIELIKKASKNKFGRIVLAIISVFVMTALCIYFGTLGSIVKAEKNEAENQKTLIVLGCQVRGNVPSLMLRTRIDAAFDYLQKNPDAKAILSGSKGNDELISEAECMYENLVEMGIDKDRLFIEDKSVNTDENIKNSLEIIKENNLSDDVAVATSDYHQKRAAMICARYSLSAHAVNAKTPAYLTPVFYTREVGGVIVESLKK